MFFENVVAAKGRSQSHGCAQPQFMVFICLISMSQIQSVEANLLSRPTKTAAHPHPPRCCLGACQLCGHQTSLDLCLRQAAAATLLHVSVQVLAQPETVRAGVFCSYPDLQSRRALTLPCSVSPRCSRDLEQQLAYAAVPSPPAGSNLTVAGILSLTSDHGQVIVVRTLL